MSLSPHARAMLGAIVASAAARYEDAADDELVALLSAENPDLDRLVSALLRTEAEARAHADGLKSYIATLGEREQALRRRSGDARLTLMNIMDTVGVRQWRAAEATISLRDPRPGVVVLDEGAVPDSFWRVKRSLDLTAIKEACDAGETIPGVAIANGSPSLTIRTK